LPESLTGTDHIVSGGPYLIKDGTVFVDVTAQKFESIVGKNPRSAIGYTKEGVLILVTVDGREKQSVGMTLSQLASMMKQLGCENAMNLDGGGSSVMWVQGRIANSPPQHGGIPISNAIVVSEKTRGPLVSSR
jgi:exopolysaccharide biosynthesis protein